MKNYKFHKTSQFRQVIKTIKTASAFQGIDENENQFMIIQFLHQVLSIKVLLNYMAQTALTC